MIKRQAHYRPLGALRFLLALIVVFQHGWHLLPSDQQGFFHDMGLGILAVVVFFMISGFVVAEASDTFYLGKPGKFLFNRVLRIVPPYLGALFLQIIAAGLLYQFGKFVPWDYVLAGSPLNPKIILGGLLSILPGLHGRTVSGQDFEFFAFVWTLRLEFTFYIISAGLLWLATANKLPNWVNASAGYIGFIAGYALFSLYCLGVIHFEQIKFVPYFLIGYSIYLFWKRRSILDIMNLIVAVGCIFWTFPIAKNAIAIYQAPVLIILLLLFFYLVFFTISSGHWKKIDQSLGKISYPLYLNHYVVLLTLTNLFPTYAGISLYISGVMLSLLLALIMHHIVEVPLNGLRDRVRGIKLYDYSDSPIDRKNRGLRLVTDSKLIH